MPADVTRPSTGRDALLRLGILSLGLALTSGLLLLNARTVLGATGVWLLSMLLAKRDVDVERPAVRWSKAILYVAIVGIGGGLAAWFRWLSHHTHTEYLGVTLATWQQLGWLISAAVGMMLAMMLIWALSLGLRDVGEVGAPIPPLSSNLRGAAFRAVPLLIAIALLVVGGGALYQHHLIGVAGQVPRLLTWLLDFELVLMQAMAVLFISGALIAVAADFRKILKRAPVDA